MIKQIYLPCNETNVAQKIVDKVTHGYFINKCEIVSLDNVG